MAQTEFKEAEAAVAYTLAGKATVTLQSLQSGKHFTFKITKDKRPAKSLWWVSLRHDGDQYHTVGALVEDSTNPHVWFNPKTERRGSVSILAFQFYWTHAVVKGQLGKSLRVMHEGTCGCCGRPLTNPESLDRGIGPYCAERKGLA